MAPAPIRTTADVGIVLFYLESMVEYSLLNAQPNLVSNLMSNSTYSQFSGEESEAQKVKSHIHGYIADVLRGAKLDSNPGLLRKVECLSCFYRIFLERYIRN